MRRYTLLVVSILFASACAGPTIDLTTSVAVENLSTGWLDAGGANGTNTNGTNKMKYRQELSFTLKNRSSQKLPPLQVNAVFRRASQTEEWGNGFRALSGAGGLEPGASSATVAIDAPLGYTGTLTRPMRCCTILSSLTPAWISSPATDPRSGHASGNTRSNGG